MRMKNRRERGEGQLGCLVGLIVLAIAIFVAYKMIPVKVRAAELRGTVVDEAKAAGTHNDEHIRNAILEKAREEKLPVTPDDIKITRAQSVITVDVDYVVPIDFPGKTYEWHINHHAENPIF
jgi:predicted membrane protein